LQQMQDLVESQGGSALLFNNLDLSF